MEWLATMMSSKYPNMKSKSAKPCPSSFGMYSILSVSKAKGKAAQLEQSEGCGHGRFLNVVRVHQNLIIAFSHVYFAKNSAPYCTTLAVQSSVYDRG